MTSSLARAEVRELSGDLEKGDAKSRARAESGGGKSGTRGLDMTHHRGRHVLVFAVAYAVIPGVMKRSSSSGGRKSFYMYHAAEAASMTHTVISYWN